MYPVHRLNWIDATQSAVGPVLDSPEKRCHASVTTYLENHRVLGKIGEWMGNFADDPEKMTSVIRFVQGRLLRVFKREAR